jgi:hypothetical protein
MMEDCPTEEALGEEIEVVPPLGRIMAIVVNVSEMADVVLLQQGVNSLEDFDQAIPMAAGKPEEPRLVARSQARAWRGAELPCGPNGASHLLGNLEGEA